MISSSKTLEKRFFETILPPDTSRRYGDVVMFDDPLGLCTCNKCFDDSNCFIHWRNFAKQVYDEQIRYFLPNCNYYQAGFCFNLPYNYAKFYKVMNSFFISIRKKYPDREYVWVKHTDDKQQVHWHVIFWSKEIMNKEVIEKQFMKFVKKNEISQSDVQFHFEEIRTTPEQMLNYLLFHTHPKVKKGPPWFGVQHHICDGSLHISNKKGKKNQPYKTI